MSFMKSAYDAAAKTPITPGMTADQLAQQMFNAQQEAFDCLPIGPALSWRSVTAATRSSWVKLAEKRLAESK